MRICISRAGSFRLIAATGCALLAPTGTWGAVSLTLRSATCTVSVRPATLAVDARVADHIPVTISSAQAGLGSVQDIKSNANSVSFRLPRRGLSIQMNLIGSDLTVRFRSAGGEFTWPVLNSLDKSSSLIWPRWEGCYVPLNDEVWLQHLLDESPWDTLQGLTMPFWGIDQHGVMVTYIATNPYNNEIRFTRTGGSLKMTFSHKFPMPRSSRDSAFVIHLGRSAAPVEPARQYRRYLMEHGLFVSMQAKLKKTPGAARLLGAVHVYLWGDGLFTRHDIPPAKWLPFCTALVTGSGAAGPSVAKHLKSLMSAAAWTSVVAISKEQWPDNYAKSEVAEAISAILESPFFYHEPSWKAASLPVEARSLIARPRTSLAKRDLYRLNRMLLQSAFPRFMARPDEWGDGVSLKMLDEFKGAGLDRLMLCVDGIGAAAKHPDVVEAAVRRGYLFGTYDSFHAIHNPALIDAESTWETAQFGDEKLYRTGAIVGQNGRPLRGFKQQGYKLSPAAARPAVEKRVTHNMAAAPFNYYFVDCDAYGEVYDDYSQAHPATQASDVAARLSRLAWIRDTWHNVIGSEGGSSYSAPVIHVAEGMFGPGFGWGDPDLNAKASPYYLGAYYPPDGPRVFVQQSVLKPKYEHLYYDPRFRLPLYETVFHDSVVTSNHWSVGSLKFSNAADTVALTELLYQVPPLYHLNLDEFAKHKDEITRHYAFFSPLHRQLGFSPMTGFAWLAPDRLVQRTEFGGTVELIANFGSAPYIGAHGNVPPRSIVARWLGSGKTVLFSTLAAAKKQ